SAGAGVAGVPPAQVTLAALEQRWVVRIAAPLTFDAAGVATGAGFWIAERVAGARFTIGNIAGARRVADFWLRARATGVSWITRRWATGALLAIAQLRCQTRRTVFAKFRAPCVADQRLGAVAREIARSADRLLTLTRFGG